MNVVWDNRILIQDVTKQVSLRTSDNAQYQQEILQRLDILRTKNMFEKSELQLQQSVVGKIGTSTPHQRLNPKI